MSNVPTKVSRRPLSKTTREALDNYNEYLANKSNDPLVQLHPTKGYRSTSLKRLKAQAKLADMFGFKVKRKGTGSFEISQ